MAARRDQNAPTEDGFTSADRTHMRRALRLAARGRGRTRPNPMVGAVIVRDGVVVGEGWHRAVGGPHAEIEALRVAGDAARGATMYVTLEPCCHHGRTGPCSRAVIAAGVSRLVAGMGDPNPLVGGGGFRDLREAGVSVACGLLEGEARALNVGFVSLVTRRRPFVTLKLAATLDGRIAAPDRGSRWITGPEARQVVQRLRREHDAVAVGRGTALADDPQLTVRDRRGRLRGPQPVRVVFDTHLALPPDARLFAEPGGPVVVVGGTGADVEARQRLEASGARVLRVGTHAGRGSEGRAVLDLAEALGALAGEDVTSVLVEGGGVLGAGLLRAGLVDRLSLFYAPKLLGGDAVPMLAGLGVERMDDVLRLEDMRVRRVGADVYVTGRPVAASAAATARSAAAAGGGR